MFSALTTILLVVSLLLGGGGVTVAAAQASMPDDWLYPVKTWSEDLRSEITRDPQTRLNLNLELAERRTAEISQMLAREEVPPEPVLQRLQTHLQTALQLAVAQNDTQAIQALERIRQRLEVQYQRLQQQANITNPVAQAVLQRTRAMIQTHLQAVQEGLQDPQTLRQRLRQGMPESVPMPPRNQRPGGNPWAQDTPTPGSGYGPGPGPEATCTPGSGPMMPTAQPPRQGNGPMRP